MEKVTLIKKVIDPVKGVNYYFWSPQFTGQNFQNFIIQKKIYQLPQAEVITHFWQGKYYYAPGFWSLSEAEAWKKLERFLNEFSHEQKK